MTSPSTRHQCAKVSRTDADSNTMADPQIVIKIDKFQLELLDKELTRLHALLSDATMREWAIKRIENIQDSLTMLKDGALMAVTNQSAAS